MDIDFTALASRVAARAEVLGCVILSKDGLVMGAFPPGLPGAGSPGGRGLPGPAGRRPRARDRRPQPGALREHPAGRAFGPARGRIVGPTGSGHLAPTANLGA